MGPCCSLSWHCQFCGHLGETAKVVEKRQWSGVLRRIDGKFRCLSRQHEMDFDSDLKLHRAAVLHKRFEAPLANRIGCGG